MNLFRPFIALLLTVGLLCACQAGEPGTPVASDDQLAEETLRAFFEHLNGGRYADAAKLYGGTYAVMQDHNPSLDPADHAALFEKACTVNGAQCLELRSVTLKEKASPTEFIFLVEFANPDGSLFELGPCCGAEATGQPQVQFEYRVVKTGEGVFKVLDMPVYLP